MAGSQKSLCKGSKMPGPVPEGIIRVYSMRFCPFAHRARLILAAKRIKHEVVNINLKDKPDWYFKKNPSGAVPAIETPDGKIVYESAVVCEYLDEVFPGVRLMPSDPYEKAQGRMLLEQYSGVISEFYKIIFSMANNEDVDKSYDQLEEKLRTLEELLIKKNTLYFGGDAVAMVDYLMWPWFERFPAFGLTTSFSKFPHVSAWNDRMMQDPAVQATFTKPDAHKSFFELYSQGSLEAVDFGLH
ncbi:glutathione S-transferase omega-1-like [Gastrophryne carolinensis]